MVGGHLWFANVYPAKVNFFDPRPALTRDNHETLIPELLPSGVKVKRFIPRRKEGGVFVDYEA